MEPLYILTAAGGPHGTTLLTAAGGPHGTTLYTHCCWRPTWNHSIYSLLLEAHMEPLYILTAAGGPHGTTLYTHCCWRPTWNHSIYSLLLEAHMEPLYILTAAGGPHGTTLYTHCCSSHLWWIRFIGAYCMYSLVMYTTCCYANSHYDYDDNNCDQYTPSN